MRVRWPAAALAAVLLFPAQAHAQLGLGMRLAFPRGGTETQADSDRLWGGVMRANLSPKTALELSLDWRTIENDDQTLRIKDYPFQGSLLIYPVRATIAPYLLGGIGWYSKRVEVLGENEGVVSSETTHPFGYHLGFGADLRLGRHMALNADYRYKFINEDDESDDGGGIPIIGAITDRLGLSRDGSMWTCGFTVYF